MSVNGDRLIEEAARALEPGANVFSADGDRIGQVLEIQDQFVKIDAPFKRDYWLNAAYVLLRDDGRIETSFVKRDLDVYKLAAPGIGDEDPAQAAVPDAAIDTDQQTAQRINMERELAMQRHDLPHTLMDGDGPPDTGGTLGEPVEVELERIGVPLPYEDELRPAVSPWRYVFAAFALTALGTVGYVGWRRMRTRSQAQAALPRAADTLRGFFRR